MSQRLRAGHERVHSRPRFRHRFSRANSHEFPGRADNYKPAALKPTAPFRIKVVIGQTTHPPIEMAANFVNFGKPADGPRILCCQVGSQMQGKGMKWPIEVGRISTLFLEAV